MVPKPDGCRGCPFDGERTGFVPFEGPLTAKLIVIAESAGEDEEREGRPLVGRSGGLFNAACRMTGVVREDVLVGNTILCRPPTVASEREWAGAIVHCGRAHVDRVLSETKPAAVLLMGGVALKRFTGMETHVRRHGTYTITQNGVENVRGSAWRASELAEGGPVPYATPGDRVELVTLPKWGGADPWVVPTIHPAYVLRGNAHLKPLIWNDMDRARRLSEGRPERQAWPDMRWIVLTGENLAPIEWTGEHVTFDTETREDGTADLLGIGNGQGVLVGDAQASWRRDLVTKSALMKVGHNLAFDVKVLGGFEKVEGPWFDTIVAAALVQPGLPRSLHETTSLYGGDGYFYWKDMEDWPRTQAVVRARLGLNRAFAAWRRLYNGFDVWWTDRIYTALTEELRHYRLMDLFRQMQMPLLRECLRLEATGMPFDAVHAAVRRAEATKRLDALIMEVKERVEERAKIRQRDAGAVLEGVQAEVEAARRRVGEACGLHPDFEGDRRRTSCPGCNALWQARRAARDEARRTTGFTRAKGRATRFTKRPFDPGSDQDWRWVLFSPTGQGGFGLKSRVKTPGRDFSLNKNALRGLMATAMLPEGARELLAARYEHGRVRSRIGKYLDPPVGPDGRIHPPYSIHKTFTGRLASGIDDTDEDKPSSEYATNAQNWPEDCRDVIVAPDGHVLVDFDFKAIEAWTTAMDVFKVVGSRAFWDFLVETPDVHVVTADAVKQHLGHAITRYQGKRTRHMWHYRASPKMVAIVLAGDGVTFRIAHAIDVTLRRMHPDVVEWWGALIAAVRRQPVLRNAFGRMWHFTLTKTAGVVVPDDVNSVVACRPQATASDIAKAAWVQLARTMNSNFSPKNPTMFESKLVNHSHDSFTFEVPERFVDRLVAHVKPWMERPVECLRGWTPTGEAFGPRVEVKVGRNWGPFHVHGPTCKATCETRVNEDGMREVRL